MNKTLLVYGFFVVGSLSVFGDDPALTIYNQNFAVVRDTVPLNLTQGVNDVPFADITAHLEPDSVILRDPTGKVKLQILEQNYRNDPVSQPLLLSLFEGKTIGFVVKAEGKPDTIVQGKIIRSGYAGHSQMSGWRNGQRYYYRMANREPIVEVEGKLQFGLPGQPIFPSLGDDTILKPMISWKINSDAPAKLDAELAYVTKHMSWQASYNIVEPEAAAKPAGTEGRKEKSGDEKEDLIDVVGWVTMDNQSGKTFNHAKIKLMAGDVNKIQDDDDEEDEADEEMAQAAMADAAAEQTAVTEKAFDEYHLYSLPRPTTLHDGETKQVEFIHAAGVKSERLYIYDPIKIDWNDWRGNMESIRGNEDLNLTADTKIGVYRQFKNSEENHLGIPLPKGRVRFYKQDDTQLEFTGENEIDHTPKDEMVKLYTGDSFDLVGERKRTDFKVNFAEHWVDETFAIKLRNHKTEPVVIRVDEHLYRWTNWEITAKSDPFEKTAAQDIEFKIPVKPDEEKTVTYTVHYSW